MKERILQGLADIEQQHNVCVLYACEAGSRAWGFASPDSDYDIRFIFAYPRQRYLTLDDPRDVIELMDNEHDLDYVGWDIRKALRLLRNTNPALLEWLASPIRYRDSELREELADIARKYHSPSAIHWHYLKMAEGNFRQYINNPSKRNEAVLTKKYLYVVNPLCKLLYYEHRHELPPLDFMETLGGGINIPGQIADTMVEIVNLKRSGLEMGRGPANIQLNTWIESEIARLKENVPAPDEHSELKSVLDAMLLRVIE